jgi:hypothetical protein
MYLIIQKSRERAAWAGIRYAAALLLVGLLTSGSCARERVLCMEKQQAGVYSCHGNAFKHADNAFPSFLYSCVAAAAATAYLTFCARFFRRARRVIDVRIFFSLAAHRYSPSFPCARHH